MSRVHSALTMTGICVSHCPDTVTNTADMSGTGLLGRNFGDFSFRGLTTAFFFFCVPFSFFLLAWAAGEELTDSTGAGRGVDCVSSFKVIKVSSCRRNAGKCLPFP